jgi:hypothetical protein
MAGHTPWSQIKHKVRYRSPNCLNVGDYVKCPAGLGDITRFGTGRGEESVTVLLKSAGESATTPEVIGEERTFRFDQIERWPYERIEN